MKEPNFILKIGGRYCISFTKMKEFEYSDVDLFPLSTLHFKGYIAKKIIGPLFKITNESPNLE